jgi:uncharacterized protein (DUF39 family)
MKSFAEINEKIKKGKAVVVTAEEIIDMVKEKGEEKVAKEVDVVTTGTFGPMCSSGAILNFGHSDPPIKMQKVWLNDVPAYAGLAAVDVYIGATELSKNRGMDYGGGHVIEDLVSKKKINLKAISYGTDCYPRREINTYISLDSINQAILFNPRNAYQNYCVATNSSDRVLHTYMGILLPKFGNATYSTSGQLSPLLNDPKYRTIGIGSRIFLGGGVGYVAFEGTQHNPKVERLDNEIPLFPAATLTLIGDLKKMSRDFLRGAIYEKYGVSLFVGVGIPIPILDEEMVRYTSIKDEDIYASIFDYSVEKRKRPVLGRVNYKELRSGEININGKKVPTASMSSYKKAREIAEILKSWIKRGEFLLQEPIEPLSLNQTFKPLEIVGSTE